MSAPERVVQRAVHGQMETCSSSLRRGAQPVAVPEKVWIIANLWKGAVQMAVTVRERPKLCALKTAVALANTVTHPCVWLSALGYSMYLHAQYEPQFITSGGQVCYKPSEECLPNPSYPEKRILALAYGGLAGAMGLTLKQQFKPEIKKD